MDPLDAWSSHYGAPLSLRALGAFLNSVDERIFGAHRPREQLTDPEALSRWLTAHGLAPEGAFAGETEFADALRLRTALREAAAANRRTTQPPPESVDLGDVADRLALRIRVGPGGVELEPAGGGEAAQAVARLAAAAVLATADGTWQRVKMCAAPDCRVVFYDESKPRTGRWCATAVCGNRAKTRRYRQRVGPSRPATPTDTPPPPG
ncbi:MULTISPECIES: CGNR zinc finger domain-containing protein [unclassified Frankia]|uniref:CGNR zinc finger domain-containing protein n=1 Tax=unclassified Frankia TaxID=2632575 RepID=UPI002024C9D5